MPAKNQKESVLWKMKGGKIWKVGQTRIKREIRVVFNTKRGGRKQVKRSAAADSRNNSKKGKINLRTTGHERAETRGGQKKGRGTGRSERHQKLGGKRT